VRQIVTFAKGRLRQKSDVSRDFHQLPHSPAVQSGSCGRRRLRRRFSRPSQNYAMQPIPLCCLVVLPHLPR
jgi:hypothetical protein